MVFGKILLTYQHLRHICHLIEWHYQPHVISKYNFKFNFIVNNNFLVI